MRITYQDKSTRQGIFLVNFIACCLLNVLMLMSCGFVKYGDDEKNRLKWKGALLGCLFIPSVATIIGAVFLMKYFIKTYCGIKKFGLDVERFKKISGLTDSELEEMRKEKFRKDFPELNDKQIQEILKEQW